MGRIAQGTKVLAEGGYEKIFRHTFETVPEEQLQNSFACYLSTSAGQFMSLVKKVGFGWSISSRWLLPALNVVIPLHQLKAINPSSSRSNPAEKYIQVISVDNHEFWYMGFLNYNGAVQCLQDALQTHDIQSV
ncbi:unnamed protein product, partial [Vitis vinifera]|uniref:GRAM domain-containing protein n=1 Tax=Vitis vinifera TaxID=29760 RepID=D7SST3_VITVI